MHILLCPGCRACGGRPLGWASSRWPSSSTGACSACARAPSGRPRKATASAPRRPASSCTTSGTGGPSCRPLVVFPMPGLIKCREAGSLPAASSQALPCNRWPSPGTCQGEPGTSMTPDLPCSHALMGCQVALLTAMTSFWRRLLATAGGWFLWVRASPRQEFCSHDRVPQILNSSDPASLD